MYALIAISTGNVCTLNYFHNLVLLAISMHRDNVCTACYFHNNVYFVDYSYRKKLFIFFRNVHSPTAVDIAVPYAKQTNLIKSRVLMPVVNIVIKEWVEDDRGVDGDDSQELESR